MISAGAVDKIEGPGGSEPLTPDAPLITMELARRVLGEKAKPLPPPDHRAEAPTSVMLALATTAVLARVVARSVARWLL